METIRTAAAPPLDDKEVARVASAVLERPLEGPARARWDFLGDAAAAGATGGLWRVSAAEDAPDRWSFVLKTVHHSEGGHQYWLTSAEEDDPYYWKREALAYTTGLVHSLPGRLRGARCYVAFERGPERVDLALEDLLSPASEWELERFRLAARHFGRAQGELTSRGEVPTDRWLSRRWFRAYVERRAPEIAPLSGLPDWIWEHPLVREAFPEPFGDETLRIWDERKRMLDLLERLPQTLDHLDAWPRNLFSVERADGEPDTVAIDWAYVGIGALGEDAGNLVPDSMLDYHVHSDHAHELHRLVLDGYLEGLAEGGWHGDERMPRFALAATASLKYVWMTPWLVHRALDAERLGQLEERFGLPGPELLRRRGQVMYLLRDLAAEARALAPALEDALG
jgi:hypothetical protein